MKKQSYFILIVILCCLLGATVSFSMIFKNIREYPQPPDYIEVTKVLDKETITTGYLEVKLKDTISYLSNNVVKPPAEIGSTSKLDANDTIFHNNPVFLVWSLLIVLMVSASFGSVPIFLFKLKRMNSKFGLSKMNFFWGTFFAVTLVLVAIPLSFLGRGIYEPGRVITDLQVLLHNGDAIIPSLIIMTVVFQIPILICIFLMGPCADRIECSANDKTSVNKAIKQFNALEDWLKRSLQVLATLIIFSVLTTTALGESIKASISIEGFNLFPHEISYMYGLFFSFFLMLIYLPTHFYLKFRSKRLIESLQEDVDLHNEEEVVWFDQISEKLTLKQTAIENIKIALTVVAPLLTSFLPSELFM